MYATTKRIIALSSILAGGLGTEVFDVASVKLINRIRGILDIRSLVLSIRKRGVPLSVALQFKKFLENTRALCSNIENVDDDVDEDQYHSTASESGFISTLPSKFMLNLFILKHCSTCFDVV